MKKGLAFGLVAVLFLMMCDIPPISESEGENPYKLYKEYRNSLYLLQKDITQVYLEIDRKNPQAVYEHILQVIEKTARLVGEVNTASQHVHDHLQISLQNHLEILLILGLSEEQKENLANLGYAEEDIDELSDWLLHYNDYYHHVSTGFTPEEMEKFYSLGFTDDEISELQTIIHTHYIQLHTAQKVVKEHQMELLNIQVLLSVTALQTLTESEKDNGKIEGKEKLDSLLNAERKLLKSVLDLSEDETSLEHVKTFSKQMYKAAEQKIRKGGNQYLVDFFVGLQMHCAALTALHGDARVGFAEIQLYKDVLSECAASPKRSVPSPAQTSEQQMTLEPPVQLKDFVGQVEEFDETNNMGVTFAFVKAPDTTLMEFLTLFSGFVTVNYGETAWVSFTLPQLSISLESLLAGGVTVTSIFTGVAGAVLLLIITAPAVGYEWPPAVPGWIEGDQVIIIVEGSYGQGHIAERAESGKDPCIRSSHQAILDDKYMIQEIVMHPEKLFYNKNTGQYIYYYVANAGKEWAVFIEEYENKYYELITAYKVDCGPPYKCRDKSGEIHEFETIIKKWICEGFILISPW